MPEREPLNWQEAPGEADGLHVGPELTVRLVFEERSLRLHLTAEAALDLACQLLRVAFQNGPAWQGADLLKTNPPAGSA